MGFLGGSRKFSARDTPPYKEYAFFETSLKSSSFGWGKVNHIRIPCLAHNCANISSLWPRQIFFCNSHTYIS